MLGKLGKRLRAKSQIQVALILAASACFGQSRRGDVITDIPFPFVAANRTLPPGKYIVTPRGETILQIYSANDQGVLVQTHSVLGRTPESVGKVVFHRYGDTYFLAEVWVAANGIGRQLFTSQAERELAKRSNVQTAVCTASANFRSGLAGPGSAASR